MKFEEALQKLETLAHDMEEGNVPIDEMANRLREAKDLIAQCRKQLSDADQQVKQILASEEES